MIQTSRIIEDRRQADGRRHVREAHSNADVQFVQYLAEADAKVDALLAIHAAQLDAAEVLAATERTRMRLLERQYAQAVLDVRDNTQIAAILKVDVAVVEEEKAKLSDIVLAVP